MLVGIIAGALIFAFGAIILRFFWNNAGIIILLFSVLWVMGKCTMIMEAQQVERDSAGLSMSIVNTGVSTGRYDIGENVAVVRITNDSDNSLASFSATCGDISISDSNGIAANTTVERSYSYIDSSLRPTRRSGSCSYDSVEVGRARNGTFGSARYARSERVLQSDGNYMPVVEPPFVEETPPL